MILIIADSNEENFGSRLYIGAKKMVPAVNRFIGHIINDEYSPTDLYTKAMMKIPCIATKALALVMNRNIKKQFAANGIDYKVNPYTSK